MHELLNQVFDELRSAYRFRWYGLLFAWAICIGGWVWAGTQPNIYEATARVFVDSSSVLQPVLGNRIVAPDVTAQLAYIREALLGHEALVEVARQTGLDATATTPQQIDNLVAGLQQSIQIQLARGGPRNSPDGVYRISYRNADRRRSVAVVDAVLDTFVESTIGVNQQQGDTAERFLNDRVSEYEARLAQAETVRAQFIKDNAERLPGSQGGYFERLRGERTALEETRRQLAIAESYRDELEAQLSGEQPVVQDAGAAGTDPPPGSLDARIRDLEDRLGDLLLDFTEAHPDVIRTQERLAALRQQRTEELAVLGVAGQDLELSALAANPVFQRLQTEVSAANGEIARINADITLREKRIADLQGLVDEVPEVEAQLARLNRDYEVIYEQYLALVRSRETQDLSRLAMDTDQIDFRIIDPPLASPNPVAPNRLVLLAGVFLAAVGAAGGLCYLLAQLKPVFHSSTALRTQVGLPVLGVVSYAWPQQVSARRIRSLVLFGAAGSFLLVAFAALLAVETLGPGINSMLAGVVQ